MIDTVYRLDFQAPRPYRKFRTGSTRVEETGGRGATETSASLRCSRIITEALGRTTLFNKQTVINDSLSPSLSFSITSFRSRDDENRS